MCKKLEILRILIKIIVRRAEKTEVVSRNKQRR